MIRTGMLEHEDAEAISDDLDAAGHEHEAHLVRLALIEGITSVPEDLAAIRRFMTPDGGNRDT
jgi:hypothetical protein